MELRWLRRLGPPIAALGAVGLLVSGSGGATARIPPSVACTGSAGDATRRRGSRIRPRPPGSPVRAGSGFSLASMRRSRLAGQQLEIGWQGGASSCRPAPGIVRRGAVCGRLVVVGTDDGARSILRAFDGADPCDWLLATEPAVIRRATIDPLGN